MGRAAKLFAIASLLPMGVVAHATGESLAGDSQQLPPGASKPQFGLGLRAGLFPPIFVTPEVTFKPGGPIALDFSALYLPSGVGLGNGGSRLTLGTHLTAEFAKPAESGWYVSAGALYYHAFADASGFYETVVSAPITVGFLVRSSIVEARCGIGVQFLSDDVPPCSGWCFQFKGPPILPALDFVLRYVF